MSLFKRIDVICVIGLILLSVILIICFNINTDSDDLTAIVTQNGDVIYNISLNSVDESYYLDLNDDFNIRLLVENDGISFVHSECPDKICVNTGKLTKNGQTAVCLPARVSVKIEKKDEADVFFTG